MSYRDILYANYSESLGDGSACDPSRHFAHYDAVYGQPTLGRESAILDVGSGDGSWLAWMQSNGFTALTGVDRSQGDIEKCRSWPHAASIVHDDAIRFLEARPTSFDLIHGKDVIEHMTKDEFVAFLELAHKALRPGGQLWLQTFNAQAPLANATRYGDFTHEQGLTPCSLAQCLRACGYNVIAVRGAQYCSSSLTGRARRLLSIPIHTCARLLLQWRHGGTSEYGEVDKFCPHSDIIAIAMRG